MSITVRREGRRWFVTVFCVDVPAQPRPATGRQIGIDLGVTVLVGTCHACGDVDAGNRTETAFRCLRCGHADHADINAAKNILRAGLAQREHSRAAKRAVA